MPTLDVYDTNREAVGSIDLEASVFGVEVREHLFHAVVRYQLAKRRQGTHATKGRALISGGGKKPFRQKGTGRARAGTTRAPHWRGGGVVHGPHYRSHAHKLPKRTRRAALCAALSRRVEENKLTVFQSLALPEIKTRQVCDLLARFEMSKVLLVTAGADDNLERSARNIPGVTVLQVAGVNVYDVLKHDHLAITVEAAAALVQRLKG
jgi:large subunit ribosomal protein L4